MSLSEALGEGLMVTAVGLIIVFSVLIILMLVMMAMKKIFYKEPQTSSEKTEAQMADMQIDGKAETEVLNEEDPNLIAVLAAAVAASLNTSAYNLKIKSYRRVGNNAPAWNKAGLRDTIDSRF